MIIHLTKELTKQHYQLLLEADPSKKLVDDYTKRGQVYTISDADCLIGIIVLLPTRPDTLEIVNLAVNELYRKQGYAQQLITHAFTTAKKHGYKTIEIGTGSTSLNQLYLYQKCGFRMTGIDKDFFIRHYDKPIIENNLQLKDMVRLSLDL
ncbi:GNAT family N-acetyltransferase [Enterococcus sp. LJL51]|uniref:GNAT family N-acetyltransferase n=1 Tax=Enterococcus sp. LJL51 TaxID=3416656 RepID=UPI003CF9BACD